MARSVPVTSSVNSSIQSETAQSDPLAPLPRADRKRKKDKADRGLPDDSELENLAIAYLAQQAKLWPRLAAAGRIPTSTPAVIASMVDDFKRRHRGESVDAAQAKSEASRVDAKRIGGAYVRYSCDNSTPHSNVDQLTNCLKKAAEEGRFILWCYIYADYAVSGLDSARQGYGSCKANLADRAQVIETLYIDDFTRASRTQLEWWRLASHAKKYSKRMIGASDNFDLSSELAEVWISIFSLLSRLFVQSTRQKVRRGMHGAAERGTLLGKPPLGFTKRPAVDECGRPKLGPDGLPTYELCVDHSTAEARVLMFQMFVLELRSIGHIRRYFNQNKIDGWEGWTSSAIRNLLLNPTAIGIFIWNKQRREFDENTGEWTTIQNPVKEWKISRRSELRIVPLDLWKKARRRLGEFRRSCPKKGKKPSRNQIDPKTLVSGLLECACCGAELKLIRSVGREQQIGSVNGTQGLHGCRLRSSKSVRYVEEALLAFIRDNLLTDSVIEELVVKTNQVLDEKALQPGPDVKSRRRQVDQLQKQIDRLVKRSAETDDEEAAREYSRKIGQLRRERAPLVTALSEEERHHRRTHARLDVANAKLALQQQRELLLGDVGGAAIAIRELLGPVVIREAPIPGKPNRRRWYASFKPRIASLLRFACPEDGQEILEGLEGEVPVDTVELLIDRVPRYERMGSEFLRLRNAGTSISAIASTHGLSWETVAEAIEFAETGQRPKRNSRPKAPRVRKRTTPKMRYKEIAADVRRMHDDEGATYGKIAQALEVSYSTVVRAYNFASPENARQAVAEGRRVRMRRNPYLPRSMFDTIRQLFQEGRPVAEIARVAGCSVNTVRRERQKMEVASNPK
jgi:DNA invertase Pin-like site-specific DNA recombinase